MKKLLVPVLLLASSFAFVQATHNMGMHDMDSKHMNKGKKHHHMNEHKDSGHYNNMGAYSHHTGL